MNLSKSKIVLNVAAQPAAPQDTAVLDWHPRDLEGLNHPAWETACEALFGSADVAKYLLRAFQKGASRDTVWRGHGIHHNQYQALKQAARIYKRGVVLDEHPPHPTTSTTSTIYFDHSLDEIINQWAPSDAVLVDHNVWRLWKPHLPSHVIPIPVSEHDKNLATTAQLAQQIPASAKRIIAVGGGVLGDMAGFVAGLKVLPLVYVPTTLLAMADSSIGGKTGVNADSWGKNQLGLFYPAQEVFINAEWLSTLSPRHLRSGIVECLKHALLSGDHTLWDQLHQIARTATWPLHKLDQLIPDIVTVKADIVRRDPFERGERAILNLGHTMGHALESLSLEVDGESAWNHGEAVAAGLCYAMRLSYQYCGFRHADTFIADLHHSGLVPNLSPAMKAQLPRLKSMLTSDKKNDVHQVRWILLSEFGLVHRDDQSRWTTAVPDEMIKIAPDLF